LTIIIEDVKPYSVNKRLIVLIFFAYLVFIYSYILFWNVVVREGILPFYVETQNQNITQQPFQVVSGNVTTPQKLGLQAQADAKVYRWGIIPVYWGALGGDFSYIHIYFFVITGFSLIVFELLVIYMNRKGKWNWK